MDNEPTSQSASSHRPQWPQFTLRTLLASMAVFGVIVAIMDELGPVRSLAFGWFLFLGAVHVMANHWGRSLRHKHRSFHPEEGPPAYAISRQSTAGVSCAPTTRLQRNFRCGRGIAIASAVGSLLGGTLGTLALWFLVRETAGYTGVLLGAI
jgi:hypothetical protein